MTKEISLHDVRDMARLSRLIIDKDEEKLFARQFGQILGHMEVLREIDTQGVEPLYTPTIPVPRTRKDEPCNARERKDILKNAPETDGEYFIVPRIV